MRRTLDTIGGDNRKGLRIRGGRGNPGQRRALIRFSRWLRTEFEFPICVPVYLFPSDHIITKMDWKSCERVILLPYRRDAAAYRIATGDYGRLKREQRRDDVLAAFICSLAHEIVHYQQWVMTGNTWERGVGRKVRAILRRYAAAVDRP